MSRFNLGLVVTANIVQARSSMRALGAETSRMVGAYSMLGQSARKYQREVSKGAAAATRAVTLLYSGGHFISRFTSRAREADYEMRGFAATVGVSVQQAEAMYRQLRKTNPELRNFAPTQVIARMKEMAQAGYSQTEVLERTAAVLRAVNASMGALDIERATELGINLEKGFGTANRTMSELFDVAIEGAAKFPMTLDKIAVGLSYATETAVAYNQSIESVIISLGTLMPITKTASKAGTAYRALLQSIVRPQTVEAIGKWGIQVRDVNGEFRDANSLLADIATKMQDIKREDEKKGTFVYEQKIREFFGTRGQAAFAAYERLPNDIHAKKGEFGGVTHFENARAALIYQQTMLSNVEGATDRFAKAMEKSSQLIHDSFVSAIDDFSIQIGKTMLPMVDELKKIGTRVAVSVTESIANTPAWAAIMKGLAMGGGLAMLASLPGLIRAMKGLYLGATKIPALTRQAEIASAQGLVPPGRARYRMGSRREIGLLNFLRLGDAGSSDIVSPGGRGVAYRGNLRSRVLRRLPPQLMGYDQRINMREHDRAAGYTLPRDMVRTSVDLGTFRGKLAVAGAALGGLAMIGMELYTTWQVAVEGVRAVSAEMNEVWATQMDSWKKDNEKFGALGDLLDKYLSGKTWTVEDQKLLYSKGLTVSWNMIMQSLLPKEYGGRGEGLEKGMARVNAGRREQFEAMWKGHGSLDQMLESDDPRVKQAAQEFKDVEARNMEMITGLVFKHMSDANVRAPGITEQQLINTIWRNFGPNDLFNQSFGTIYAGDPGGDFAAARQYAEQQRIALSEGGGGMLSPERLALRMWALSNQNKALDKFIEASGGIGAIADSPELLQKMSDLGRTDSLMGGISRLGGPGGLMFDAGNQKDLDYVAKKFGEEMVNALKESQYPYKTTTLDVRIRSTGSVMIGEGTVIGDVTAPTGAGEIL